MRASYQNTQTEQTLLQITAALEAQEFADARTHAQQLQTMLGGLGHTELIALRSSIRGLLGQAQKDRDDLRARILKLSKHRYAHSAYAAR